MEEDEAMVAEEASLRLAAAATVPPPASASVPPVGLELSLAAQPAFSLTSVRNSIAAGYVAGVSGILIGHPLDSIKVLIQTSRSNAVAGGGRGLAPKRSLLSLYSGVQGPLMTVGVVQAINFAVYDSIRRQLHSRRHPDNKDDDGYLHKFALADVMVASSVAGGVVATITSPLMAIKTNQQIRPRGFRQTIRKLCAAPKGGAFFSGFWPHMFCDSFGRMCYLSCYELLKINLRDGVDDGVNDTRKLSLYERIICAGASGMICWTIIYPADVLRSRMYANALAEYRPNLLQMVKSIYAEENSLKPFYRGLGVTVLRAGPVAAAVLPVYDYAHSWLTESH